MWRHTRTTSARLALAAVGVLALGAPLQAVASAQDTNDPWTVPLGHEQIAVLAADVQQDAESLVGLEPVAVFGGEPSGESGVTSEMTIGQRRYRFPGSLATSGLAAMADSGDHPSNWTIHSTGVESYFSTSADTNVVVETVPSGTLSCGPGEYAELATFELYPGTPTIDPNPAIPNDPGVGASSAYSVVCTDGETSPFQGIANKGVLQQYAPGVGIVEANLPDVDVYVFFTPRDVDLRVAQSAAADLTVAEVDVVTAPDGRYGSGEPVDPATLPTDPTAYGGLAADLLTGLLDVPSGPGDDEVLGDDDDEVAGGDGVAGDDGVNAGGVVGDEGPATDAVPVIEGELPPDDPESGFEWVYVAVPFVVGGVLTAWILVPKRRRILDEMVTESTEIWVADSDRANGFVDHVVASLKMTGAEPNERGRYVVSAAQLAAFANGSDGAAGSDLRQLFDELNLESKQYSPGCLSTEIFTNWYYKGPKRMLELDPSARALYETRRVKKSDGPVSMDEQVVIS